MERGVVVGGLMICGSFLLAASLNRSAVKENPPAEPPAAAVAITPPLPAVSAVEPPSAECAPAGKAADQAIATDPADQGDLQGNGPKDCSQ